MSNQSNAIQPNSLQQPRRRQGIFWLLTIPRSDFTEPSALPDGLAWIRGQLERGEGGFEHWQIMVALSEKSSLRSVKRRFGNTCHGELSRSAAANDYVWKESSRIGQQFEFGTKPIRRNSKTDWEACWKSATKGDLMAIPASIRLVSYRTLLAIAADHVKPTAIVRECFVYWGKTGTGKSRLAWQQAGMDAYPKDPRSKFWCGYQGEDHVVIDEFRGGIDLSHVYRWLDRYPIHIEVKGSSRPLVASKIWMTSNLNPRTEWFPEANQDSVDALMRRLQITHFEVPFTFPE